MEKRHNINKYHKSNSKARKWLQSQGYTQIHFFNHSRWSKDVHIGQMGFDGVAVHEAHIVFFQVKSNRKPTKKEKIILKALNSQYEHSVVFIWINCPDRKKTEIY